MTRLTNSPYYIRTTGVWDYNSAYSWMAWIQPKQLSRWHGIFYVGATSDSAEDYIEIQDTNNFELVASVGGTVSVTSGTAVSVDVWKHICLRRTSATLLEALVDGAVILTRTIDVTGRTAATQYQTGLWGVAGPGDNANMRVNAEGIWTRALSDAEVINQMRSYVPVSTTSLYAWSPRLSVADDEIDYSGNGRTWTVSGTPTTEDGPPIAWRQGRQRRVYVPAAGGGATAFPDHYYRMLRAG